MNLFERWAKLFLLVVFTGTSINSAIAGEPNNSITEKGWLKFSSDVSSFLAKESVSQAQDAAWINMISEGSLRLFAKLGQFLPEDVAKKVLSDPQKLAQIMNDSASEAFKKNVTAIDMGDLALGVVTDSFVNFIREEWHPKNAYEEGVKELGVYMIRETGTAYALETKGVPGAIVAQTMVSGKTIIEALQAGVAVYKQNKENEKLDAQNMVGEQFLKLRAELKAETDDTKKKQLLSQIDQLLQGEGSFLFASSNDPNQARKNYIEILAKNSGISLSTLTGANNVAMQNQLTAITQGGSSHIGSAALFTGYHTSTPSIINPVFTASLKNQTAAEQGVFANSQAYSSSAWQMVTGTVQTHFTEGSSFGPISAAGGGQITGLNNANVQYTHIIKEFQVPVGVKQVTLTLNGNFVTNEYPVYVGSQYNDYGVVKLISPSGNATQVTAFKEVLNSSNFQNVSGLPSPMMATGGQTGFKSSTATIPVANGGKVVVDVQVHNVGDTLYPSAVLLNAVQLK